MILILFNCAKFRRFVFFTDGNKEDEEEMSGLVSRGADLDFDQLLKQATQKLKKPSGRMSSARH